MYTADFGNMEQLYSAIQMTMMFSYDTTESIWGFDLLRIEMMTKFLTLIHP